MIDEARLCRLGPADASTVLVLAHGAGAGMDHPFMLQMAEGIVAEGIGVVRFEFPYMHQRRLRGGRRPPDRGPTLDACYRSVLQTLGSPGRLVIGGKSMGGRVASRIADDCGVRGLVCLGYPFHPPRKPDKLRTAHLAHLRCPTLILQGTRDPFGNQADVAGYVLSPSISVRWLPDGDHGFVPRRRSGHTEAENMGLAIAAVVDFLRSLPSDG